MSSVKMAGPIEVSFGMWAHWTMYEMDAWIMWKAAFEGTYLGMSRLYIYSYSQHSQLTQYYLQVGSSDAASGYQYCGNLLLIGRQAFLWRHRWMPHRPRCVNVSVLHCTTARRTTTTNCHSARESWSTLSVKTRKTGGSVSTTDFVPLKQWMLC